MLAHCMLNRSLSTETCHGLMMIGDNNNNNGQSVCLSVYSESAHLDAIALCLYYGKPQHNKVVVSDFYVKASFKASNKREQKLSLISALG